MLLVLYRFSATLWVGLMEDFTSTAKGFMNELQRAFSKYAPVAKWRSKIKQMARQDPDSLQNIWTRYFRGDSYALSAL